MRPLHEVLEERALIYRREAAKATTFSTKEYYNGKANAMLEAAYLAKQEAESKS